MKLHKKIVFIICILILLIFAIIIKEKRLDSKVNSIINKWNIELNLKDYLIEDYYQSKSGWYGEQLKILTLKSKYKINKDTSKSEVLSPNFIWRILEMQKSYDVHVLTYEILSKAIKGSKDVIKKQSNSAEQYNDELYIIITYDSNDKMLVYLIENLNVLDMDRYQNYKFSDE